MSSKASCAGSVVGVELAEFDGLPGESFEQRQPLTLLGGDRVADRTGAGADVSGGRREEAAARERRDVRYVRGTLARGEDPLNPFGRAERGVAGRGARMFAGGVDRRQLQFLFGSEVGVETALAHVGRERELPDREALKAVDRCQARGLVEDRGPGSVALGPLLDVGPPSN